MIEDILIKSDLVVSAFCGFVVFDFFAIHEIWSIINTFCTPSRETRLANPYVLYSKPWNTAR